MSAFVDPARTSYAWPVAAAQGILAMRMKVITRPLLASAAVVLRVIVGWRLRRAD